jgi:predicted house-cleaning noncanonical NTP pyrophosphatase (MazG superfamily)
MSILERFVEFARALPDKDRQSVEDLLDSIMRTASDSGFADEQLAELDRRMAEENPEYATDEEVAAVFERPARK